MGLAERFKDKLSNRDIFKKNAIEQTLAEKNIEFISKPLEIETIQQNSESETNISTEDISDVSIETTEQETLEEKPVEVSSSKLEITNILELNPAEETTATDIECSTKHTCAKFEELETEIINKIRKTPYWEDFTRKQQENMISKYFDAKIQREKYRKTEYSLKDKFDFIQNIMVLSNNR